MPRSATTQMLRQAYSYIKREAARANKMQAGFLDDVAAHFKTSKRVRKLEHKIAKAEADFVPKSTTPPKGWPRAYEFGTHRNNRHLRKQDWWAFEDGSGGTFSLS